MKKINFNIFFMISLVFILFLFIPMNSACTKYSADHGSMNLSNYDFKENVELKGSWDLYFNKLLLPNELEDNNSSVYNIPGKLSKQVSNASQGYMTLHLCVSVPWDNIYGLYIPSMYFSEIDKLKDTIIDRIMKYDTK